jgi:hypothetical protein
MMPPLEISGQLSVASGQTGDIGVSNWPLATILHQERRLRNKVVAFAVFVIRFNVSLSLAKGLILAALRLSAPCRELE